MALSNATKLGAAVFIGTAQFGMLMIVSEILYSKYGTNPLVSVPGYAYSVSSNYISDLGATCPTSGACYIPPSALLFNASVALLGLFMLVGAYYFRRAFKWLPVNVSIALVGIGALGVGLFPETTGIVHHLFSMITFLFAGITAIIAYKFQRKPMGYISVLLGVITLLAAITYGLDVYLGLGGGGMERMVVYPVVFWGVAFGGHMMGQEDKVVQATH